MKKVLLILISAGFAVSANAQHSFTKQDLEMAKYIPSPKGEKVPANEQAFKSTRGPVTNNKGVGETILEETTYDLQTNATVQDRIVMDENGNMAATWTASELQTTSFNDRGTGYSFYDASTGQWTISPDYPRIESNRCGWSSILFDGSGGEIVVAHSTASSDIKINTRTVRGQGQWTESSLTPAPNVQDLTWNRSAIGGPNQDILHIVALTDTLDSAKYHMWRAPVYYRSKDGGSTFDIEDFMIPGIDTTAYGHTNSFWDHTMNTDAYAIAARGNTVAIAMFNEYNDVILVKSDQNGDKGTWVTTIVNDFEYQSFNDMINNHVNPDPINNPDVLETCDGTGSILIDTNGMVHITFGRTYIANDSVLGTRDSYRFPRVDSLIYWNEGLGTDGGIYVGHYMGSSVSDISTVQQWGENFGTNFLTYPNMSLGDDGTIYTVYSGVHGDTLWGGDGTTHMRKIYLIKSEDDGVTWSDPVDLTADKSQAHIQEHLFPDIVDRTTDRIRLIFQRDWHPGIYVSGLTGGAAAAGRLRQEQNTQNEIVYYEVGLGLEIGVESVLNQLEESSIYPNPSNGNVNLVVSVLQDVQVNIDVTDMNGKVVHTYAGSQLQMGRNQVEMDLSHLGSGLYFINMRTSGDILTKKVIIE